MQLYVLDELYAVVRLDPDGPLPLWAQRGHFRSVTRTDTEMSIVCREDDVPVDASAERGWVCFQVAEMGVRSVANSAAGTAGWRVDVTAAVMAGQ